LSCSRDLRRRRTLQRAQPPSTNTLNGKDKRTPRNEERLKKRELKKLKAIAKKEASCGCGYPRHCIGKRGKTENDKWHEDYHVKFEEDPFESETYKEAKVAAARDYPSWFNDKFDDGSISSCVRSMS
jgi:hypothetical protein